MKTSARATCRHHVADPGSIEVSQATVLPPSVVAPTSQDKLVEAHRSVARTANEHVELGDHYTRVGRHGAVTDGARIAGAV